MSRMSLSTLPPLDSYQLLSTSEKSGEIEDTLFIDQVNSVNTWWESQRFQGIKRPYSAEDVVSKRGTLQQAYPSSIMAKKLFGLLEKRASEGEPLHTSQSSPSSMQANISSGSH